MFVYIYICNTSTYTEQIELHKVPSSMDFMAKNHVDPYSVEGLAQRHENRQLLLQRLSLVRQQIKDLEREVPGFQTETFVCFE